MVPNGTTGPASFACLAVPIATYQDVFLKKHSFPGDIVPGILKKSICFRNPYDTLETRLLALSTNIAVDSPKHRKGCKKKMRISGCLEPYRFSFLDFATLTRFWRGASGHENSLFECLDNYNSRFWSSNDDSCTLLQGRFATPLFS